MRRSTTLGLLFVIGCETAPNPNIVSDKNAARELVQSLHRPMDIIVEDSEYATIPKIPRKGVGKSPPDRAAACGVRVLMEYRDGNRFTTDDWVVWVTSDHKAIDWSGNPVGDNWRQWVQSFAKK